MHRNGVVTTPVEITVVSYLYVNISANFFIFLKLC
jgi:hypothetical protein